MGNDDDMEDVERQQDESMESSGEVVHGGEGDPLGGGVADLEDSDEVAEGIPRQGEDPEHV